MKKLVQTKFMRKSTHKRLGLVVFECEYCKYESMNLIEMTSHVRSRHNIKTELFSKQHVESL